jgi:acyl-CoA dehydrogenase
VINGHKWFSSNASVADFLIVMCVTDPDVSPYQGSSMIIVPVETPGVDIVRDIPTMDHPMSGLRLDGGHAEVIYRDVRVPKENLVGSPGDGFRLAQQRLGPGRIHHAMRWLGQSGRAFDMLCERAVSRYTHGSVLADKQMVQDMVARGARVLHDVIDRAIQVHGSLGFSGDLPLELMYRAARAARIYDGPDEVHKATVARRILRGYTPREVPTEHVPTRAEAARRKFAAYLDVATADL